MQKKQRYQQDRLRAAGKLWCEEDFESMKLDLLCTDTVESAATLPKKTARIFRAWEERWEQVKIGPGGDDVHEARLVRKYGGLRWLDADNGYRVCETERKAWHVAGPMSVRFVLPCSASQTEPPEQSGAGIRALRSQLLGQSIQKMQELLDREVASTNPSTSASQAG